MNREFSSLALLGVLGAAIFGASVMLDRTAAGPGSLLAAIGSSQGRFQIELDAGSPAYRLVHGGERGIELLRLKVSAGAEGIDLRRLTFEIPPQSPSDARVLLDRKLEMFDEHTGVKVGEAFFTDLRHATSSLLSQGDFRVPAASTRILIVRGDIAPHAAASLYRSGEHFEVQYDADAAGVYEGAYGQGVTSGIAFLPRGTDTKAPGMRVLKAYPRFTLPEGAVTVSRAANQIIYRFSASAAGGDVALYKMAFLLQDATTSSLTSEYVLHAYTDSNYSRPDRSFHGTGSLEGSSTSDKSGGKLVSFYTNRLLRDGSLYALPADQTRYFELRASLDASASADRLSIPVSLLGDALPHGSSTSLSSALFVDEVPSNNFIWSPMTLGTTTPETEDFANGFGVEGLILRR